MVEITHHRQSASPSHDRFGRRIDYLRISLTDHCNLRCVYCMPLHGLTFEPPERLLTAAEIERVVRAAAELGFRKVRLTGGEPTLRADLLDIVRRIAGVEGIADLSLTTNGILLPRLAGPLRQAGLGRVNIHVDSLNPQRLERVMRFGSLKQIWAGIEAAERAGFFPIKINAVVVKGFNEHDVADLARLTLERDWHVRFVELMPFGEGECARLSIERFVSNATTRRGIETALGPLTELANADSSDESRNYRADRAPGVIGFISPVSEPYCGSCNRMRLTADGRFHLCLLQDEEIDVRSALRNGGGDLAVRDLLKKAIDHKPIGHRLEEGRSTKDRAMFQIGG